MPVYEWECSKCGKRETITCKITDYMGEDLSGFPHHACYKSKCDGLFERIFDGYAVGHSWKDGKPTPKFGG